MSWRLINPKQEELRTHQRCVTQHLIRVKSASVLRIMILHILYSMRNLSETEIHPETIFQKTWESVHTRWSNLIAQSQLDSRNQQDRKCSEKTAHRPICRLPHIDCLCLALLGSHIWATPRSIKEVSQWKICGSNPMYPVYHSRSLTSRYRYSSTERFSYPTQSQV